MGRGRCRACRRISSAPFARARDRDRETVPAYGLTPRLVRVCGRAVRAGTSRRIRESAQAAHPVEEVRRRLKAVRARWRPVDRIARPARATTARAGGATGAAVPAVAAGSTAIAARRAPVAEAPG